ncbi:hypothetical protein [Bradyrhizobium sp. 15]|uniref:hypothetical protein n=1 Tax=Bradyrhizobium sp. 15 TaxID=2782633 RepID=UPI001FF97F06|nr:hypothetical protein [Bradyrhizobium sp. 15]MCK1437071.1 hypothetical protein [Bradyrhizobium sp. 15]
MTALKIELEWCRDSKGYELVDVPNRGKWIIGKGGAPHRYNPFEMADGDAPLLAFANAQSEEKLHDFAIRYGYLTKRGYSSHGEVRPPIRSIGRRFHWDIQGNITGIDRDASIEYLEGESVDEFVAVAKLFKRVLSSTSERLSRSLSDEVEDLLLNYGSLNDVLFSFKIDHMRRFHPVISPGSLISGLLVRLAQLAGGSSFKTCQLARCGTLFVAGGRSGLRADAKFCSPAHRIEHNSRNRAKAAPRRST